MPLTQRAETLAYTKSRDKESDRRYESEREERFSQRERERLDRASQRASDLEIALAGLDIQKQQQLMSLQCLTRSLTISHV